MWGCDNFHLCMLGIMLHLTPDSHFYNKIQRCRLKKKKKECATKRGVFWSMCDPMWLRVFNAMSPVSFYQSLIQCFNKNRSIFWSIHQKNNDLIHNYIGDFASKVSCQESVLLVPCEEPCVPNAMSPVLFYQSLIQCYGKNRSIFD